MTTTDTGYCQQPTEMPRRIISPMRELTVIPIVQEETDINHAPWASARKALPGLSELRWVESNPPALQDFAGRWVAVKGNQVVESGESFDAVHSATSAANIQKALIIFVRGADPEDIYDIA